MLSFGVSVTPGQPELLHPLGLLHALLLCFEDGGHSLGCWTLRAQGICVCGVIPGAGDTGHVWIMGVAAVLPVFEAG